MKTVDGDKFQGLLSRTIDKALGGMQESSEDAVQNNHPANSVQNSSTEASNDTHEDPTQSPSEWGSHVGFRRQLLRRAERMTRKRFRTRLPQHKQSQRISLQRVSQPNRCRQRKQLSMRPQRRRWLSRSLLLTRRRCSRMHQGTLDHQRLEEKRKHAGFFG